MFTSLSICGLRGFATAQTVAFAVPNGKDASGLTVLIGPNNAGKSTVIEALRALTQNDAPSFAQGRRNRVAGDQINIVAKLTNGDEVSLKSTEPGTSECIRTGPQLSKVFALPSRRAFAPFFGRSESARDTYMQQIGFPAARASTIDPFSYRLFHAQRNRAAFDALLGRVLQPVPKWSIDQQDGGQHFIKFVREDAVHSSEGLGEGLVSLLFIVDALYDSAAGDSIVIDEPELSLHPSLARKVAALIAEYSRDRQIIVATHSPYFVNLRGLERGSTVARVHLRQGCSTIAQLGAGASNAIQSLLTDQNNPHLLGTNAQEAFFLEDRVILVEGQEDVVFHETVARDLKRELTGTFFGWGVGGAGNMQHVAAILHDLGFERVAGLLDADKAALLPALRQKFPAYFFDIIPADDVRSKPAVKARDPKPGLLDEDNTAVRAEHRNSAAALFDAVNAYLV